MTCLFRNRPRARWVVLVVGRRGWDNGTTPVLYAYDKSGNRVQAGTTTFVYDERNQLQSASDGTSYQYTARGTLRHTTSGTVTGDTTVDAFGQVVSQQDPGGTASTYTYAGLGRAIQAGFSYTGVGNTLAADASATYVRGPGDELVGVSSAGVQRYAWTDRHTDVVGQFTASSAALDASTTYEPFGLVVASAGMVGSLGYQSGWTDFGTGRVNMWARWYNPDTGQFDTRDTATISPVPTSIRGNRFAYADANPLTMMDPTGHAATSGEEDMWCKKDLDECLLDSARAEVAAYERQLARAEKEAGTSLFSVLLTVGIGFLLDMIGYNSIVGCFGKGDWMACAELAMDFIGPVRAIKIGKKLIEAALRGFKAYSSGSASSAARRR